MKDLFYLFIAFFFFFCQFIIHILIFQTEEKNKRIFRSRRKAMNRRKKKFKLL